MPGTLTTSATPGKGPHFELIVPNYTVSELRNELSSFTPPLHTKGLKHVLQARLQPAYLGCEKKNIEEEIAGWFKLDKELLVKKCKELGLSNGEIGGKTKHVLLRLAVIKMAGLGQESHIEGVEKGEVSGREQPEEFHHGSTEQPEESDHGSSEQSEDSHHHDSKHFDDSDVSQEWVVQPSARDSPSAQAAQDLERAVSKAIADRVRARTPAIATTAVPSKKSAAENNGKGKLPPYARIPFPPPEATCVDTMIFRLQDVEYTMGSPCMMHLDVKDELYMDALTELFYKKFFTRMAEIQNRF